LGPSDGCGHSRVGRPEAGSVSGAVCTPSEAPHPRAA
jgi:hypothetical protein